jgi:LytS/YehU family sensor histidine kinase
MKSDCRRAHRNTSGEATSNDKESDDIEAAVPDVEITETPTEKRIELADIALAVLAILWVVWFVGRARSKAEARADRAEATAEREALERQVAEARLQALQAQVEPHFLFNTLGAVEHLIETDPPRAATMQRHLIAFLRGAMPRMRGERVTLGEEIELCRNYLAIMKIRMEDRLDYNIDLPAELGAADFPPMMLQSVVENAIKHGLEPKAEGGSLWLSARAAAGRLRVSVADSGLGFGNGTTAGTGVGLNNIRERLAGLFGNEAALVISPNAPTGTQVTIEIPHGNDGNHRG